MMTGPCPGTHHASVSHRTVIHENPDTRTFAPDQGSFRWNLRIYYEDTDATGIVYHANYLKYCERARTEWLRSRSFQQAELSRDRGLHFVLARATVKFLSPARLDDELEVSVIPERIGRVSHDRQPDVCPNRSGRT